MKQVAIPLDERKWQIIIAALKIAARSGNSRMGREAQELETEVAEALKKVPKEEK